MPRPNYVYSAEVLEVKDGDTLVVRVDHGFEPILSVRDIRMLGYNTPEKTGVEKPWGLISKAYLQHLIKTCGNKVVLQSVKPDKFGGRWNATIWPWGSEISLNQIMIDKKFGYAYKGDKKLDKYPVDQIPVQPGDFDYDTMEPKKGWGAFGL